MMINIVSPHFSAIGKIFFNGCLKCIDRGCTCDRRRTRKLVQADYEQVYTGPEFLIEVRYSQIISTVFIMMIYSSGIPALYIVGFVQFFLMYWVDKFLCKISSYLTIIVIRVYKTPPRYGMELSDIARKVIVYAMVIHLCFGFYMFSNSAIFTYESDFKSLDFVKNYLSNDLNDVISNNQYLSVSRIFQTHTLIYILGAIAFLIIFLFMEIINVCCTDAW
jgi:hypothetical protein